ncbi:MAG: dTDP-4-dehydrorhamnose 3,5-epimerase [Chitinivibrionales bacterium]
MEFIPTPLNDLWIIQPKVFKDNRGFFLESFSHKWFQAQNIPINFVQDNHSLSVKRGVLRGLHFQKPPAAQSKLIRVVSGAIYDVAVDLRKNSPNFGQWFAAELSAENFRMLLVPAGFAHGFCTLTDNTEVIYKVDAYYSPENDRGIRWNDPALNITWPVKEPILSEKDSRLPFLSDTDTPF